MDQHKGSLERLLYHEKTDLCLRWVHSHGSHLGFRKETNYKSARI